MVLIRGAPAASRCVQTKCQRTEEENVVEKYEDEVDYCVHCFGTFHSIEFIYIILYI